jgi:hypothetical protein
VPCILAKDQQQGIAHRCLPSHRASPCQDPRRVATQMHRLLSLAWVERCEKVPHGVGLAEHMGHGSPTPAWLAFEREQLRQLRLEFGKHGVERLLHR